MTYFPALMYHAASQLRGRFKALGVPAATLRKQLAGLAHEGWTLTGLSEALSMAEEGRRDVIALTFDDAYGDFAECVLPILGDLGARATLYVPTAHVGEPARWLGRYAEQLPRLLSWCELEHVAASGRVEIGSHSHTHVHLDTLTAADLEREVTEPRVVLEERLTVEVRSFCYPHGYHSAPVRDAVRAAGYDNACEVGRRLRSTQPRFAISRLAVDPADTPQHLARAVRAGGPVVVPAAKRVLQPAWRGVRRGLVTRRAEQSV
jgi:peptidoglycan/xylan/chitin deacetylase (PgdA/CDA1 family)